MLYSYKLIGFFSLKKEEEEYQSWYVFRCCFLCGCYTKSGIVCLWVGYVL